MEYLMFQAILMSQGMLNRTRIRKKQSQQVFTIL